GQVVVARLEDRRIINVDAAARASQIRCAITVIARSLVRIGAAHERVVLPAAKDSAAFSALRQRLGSLRLRPLELIPLVVGAQLVIGLAELSKLTTVLVSPHHRSHHVVPLITATCPAARSDQATVRIILKARLSVCHIDTVGTAKIPPTPMSVGAVSSMWSAGCVPTLNSGAGSKPLTSDDGSMATIVLLGSAPLAKTSKSNRGPGNILSEPTWLGAATKIACLPAPFAASAPSSWPRSAAQASKPPPGVGVSDVTPLSRPAGIAGVCAWVPKSAASSASAVASETVCLTTSSMSDDSAISRV